MTLVTLLRNHKSIDLFLVNSTATIALFSVLIGIDFTILRTLVGLPLVLGIPGYLLITLLGSLDEKKQVSEVAIYSIGLSIAIVITLSLLLSISPWGIQARSVAIALALFTYLTSCFIYIKRQISSDTMMTRKYMSVNINKPQGLLLVYALIIMFGAFVVSYMGANQARQTNFTEFWMVPNQSATEKSIAIGLRNVEHRDVSYDVQLKSNDTIIQEWKSVGLKPGESWSRNTMIPLDAESLEALLYRDDNLDQVYRRVTLTVPKPIISTP